MRAQYLGAACSYSQKRICSFLLMKQYVVLGQLQCFYLDCGMRLVKVHCAILFISSWCVASYIVNNTAKRQKYKHDDVTKAFFKRMNNAPYGKTIENVERQTNIRLLNDMEKVKSLAEKPTVLTLAYSMAR